MSRLDLAQVTRVLLWSAATVLAVSAPGCRTARTDPGGQKEVYTDALRAVGLTPRDLRIPGDLIPDPDRLSLAIALLDRPLLAAETVAPLIRLALTGPPTDLLEVAALALELNLQPAVTSEASPAPPLLAGLPVSVRDELGPLILEVSRACDDVAAERARFSGTERRLLRRLRDLVDPAGGLSEATGDSVIQAGRRVDRARLVGAARRLLNAVDRASRALVGLLDSLLQIPGGPIVIPTRAGPVVIAGTGDDVHEVSAAVILDLGGDDRYEADAGTANADLPVSVCIDLGGADTYQGLAGVGTLGLGICLDLSGIDDYQGSGQGAGIAGVGMLVDLEGDDVYRGEIACQGFGLYGVGVLFDGAGHDRYQADLLAQGAGGPGGVGILRDAGGSDHYTAGGRYADFREANVFLSMAQGFGCGIRPRASGGVGLLADGSGDDIYRADYFGQGSADWAGVGLLVDAAGGDRYEARRYSQGCGTHLSAGLLLDGAGDDVYQLWGVGQGCGHDLAVGILKDRTGDDHYTGDWLCMGAGSANGVGILEDAAGNDAYESERLDTMGYGSLSRDHESIGLFVDRDGADRYVGPGKNGSIWTNGSSGVGLDLPVH